MNRRVFRAAGRRAVGDESSVVRRVVVVDDERRTAGGCDLDRIGNQFFGAVHAIAHVQLRHVFGGAPLLIEDPVPRQAPDVGDPRGRSLVQLLDSVEQRIAPGDAREDASRVVVLRLEPVLDFRALEILHVSIRVFDLVSEVLVDDHASRRGRRSLGCLRERGGGRNYQNGDGNEGSPGGGRMHGAPDVGEPP